MKFIETLNRISSALAPFGVFAKKHPFFTVAVVFAIGYGIIESGQEARKKEYQASVAKARQSKLDAMSVEERTKFLADEAKKKADEEKKKKFDEERTYRAYLLKELVKKSAFDADALKFGETKYYKNGVCIYANGKNRFGAYVGFKEYCYLINAKGEWYIQEN